MSANRRQGRARATRRGASAPDRTPPPQQAALGPALEFLRLMWAINHRLDRVSRHMQRRFGVTGPQRLVLRILDTSPKLSAGDLAQILHVHPSTLTGILQRLEARRLLRRVSDPADGRRVQLEITTRGKRLTAPQYGPIESSIKRLLARLSAADLKVTRRALAAIAEELELDGG